MGMAIRRIFVCLLIGLFAATCLCSCSGGGGGDSNSGVTCTVPGGVAPFQNGLGTGCCSGVAFYYLGIWYCR